MYKKRIMFILLISISISFLSAAKIDGYLLTQVKYKQAWLEKSIEIKPQIIVNSPNLETQLIYLHFKTKPDSRLINRLESQGIKLYPESWIPPLDNHPTGFLTAKIPAERELLTAISKNKEIIYLNSAERTYELYNDLAAVHTGVAAVSDSPDNLTGEGVRIAVIDSGFEINHTDMPQPEIGVDYSNYSVAYPDSDFTISNAHTGTVSAGHGTHVAGSIVGQGTLSNGLYKGMAPDAEWVALKVMKDYLHTISEEALVHSIKASSFYYDADLINLSAGGITTYLDGSSELCQTADLVFENGSLLFTSASNKGDDDEHFSGSLAAGESEFVAVNYNDTSSTRESYLFNLVWYDGSDTTIVKPMTMSFYNHNYNPLTIQNTEAMTQSPRGTQSVYGDCTTIGSNNIFIKVENLSDQTLTYHLYTMYSNAKFNNADANYTVMAPGVADNSFTVGAWTTRNEWENYSFFGVYVEEEIDELCSFSSRGPRIDGYQKPEITAPGAEIISLRDHDAISDPPPYGIWDMNVVSNTDESGLPADYLVLQGTSMSSPIACGAAALLKDYYPQIDNSEIIVKLWNHADMDSYTGSVPNADWGCGKINVEASLAALKAELKPETVQNVGISKIESGYRLSWNEVTESVTGLSISIDHYKVFAKEIPDDAASYEIGTTVNTYYDISPDENKKFFHVVAVYSP